MLANELDQTVNALKELEGKIAAIKLQSLQGEISLSCGQTNALLALLYRCQELNDLIDLLASDLSD